MGEGMKKEIGSWEVLESRMSYEDPWLKVRTDRCRTAQGKMIEAYHVVESSTWVNVLALTAAGQVVLVREYRHGVREVLTGLPGGVVEGKDESLCAAIQRELREETGYGGGTFFELGYSYANASKQNNIVWSFLALDVLQLHEQDLDEIEDVEVMLQDFISFNRQAWSGEIRMQAFHLATLGMAFQFILRSDNPQLRSIRSRML
jgi:ADP-ribose pyrophosphatase